MNPSLEIILPITVLICALWYTVNGLLLNRGLNRKYKQIHHAPRVSVLVAARNEEAHLPHCLDSLAQVHYPKQLSEIIILNDRSSDRTMVIAEKFARQNSHFRVVDIVTDKYGLKGKMNVLAQGLGHATGEIILVTDADCVVPQSWIEEFVSFFTPETGMVGGLTFLKGDRLLHHLQALDWLFLQSIASGTAGIGRPVTILGNNFAFRKSAYDQVGGFPRIGFSLTEDMALMQAIDIQTEYEIVYPLNKGHMIWSQAENSIREVYNQRLRWISGGKKASLWGYSLMISAFLAKLMILASLLLGIISPVTIFGFILMLGIEFLLPWSVLRRVGHLKLMTIWPLFQLYYFIYTVVFGLIFWIPQRVKWKKRTYGSGE